MPKDFKQYDSRWGSKSYAGGTMSGCGCGPTSVADLVYDSNNAITPYDVAKWLTANGFAGKAGNGTIRWGITHALEHYGFTDVRGIRNSSDDKSGKNDPTMKEFCELIATGEYMGVILFTKGTKGGITWTTSGHFVSVIGAKKSGSDYILSVYDGGQREHDGNYSYNKTMKGLCYRAFVGKPPKIEPPKPAEPHEIKEDGSWGTETSLLSQQMMNKYDNAGLVEDGIAKKLTWKAIQSHIGLTGKDVDGDPQSKTWTAMQEFLKARGLYDKAVEGKKGYYSIKGWQTYLNSLVRGTPIQPIKKKYQGTLPSIGVTRTAAEVAKAAAEWAIAIAGMNDFHYGEGGSSSKDFGADVYKITHTRGCYFCNGNSNKVSKIQALKRSDLIAEHWRKTYVCNPLVFSAFVHGGLVASMKCEDNGDIVFTKSPFKQITKPTKANLHKGDVLLKYVDGKFQHAAMYIGNGKIVEATSYKGKYGSDASNSSIRTKTLTDANYKNYNKICRFNASINNNVSIKIGENSSRVGEWQDFLNWYTDGEFYAKCGGRGLFFGENTAAYTARFQSENGLDPDRKVGANTLKKAGEIEK